uniref:Putative transforming growth factor beta regulator 1 n=1 Tax=Triatoma dimidiata TaxID=72491 RepID=A0A0V0GE77_TRIDM
MLATKNSKFSISSTLTVDSKINTLSKDSIQCDKYKIKYRKIKRLVKELIFENAALCDQIALLQEKTLLLIDERNYLFKKLQQYQPISEQELYRNSTPVIINDNRKAINKKKSEKIIVESSNISEVPKTVKTTKKPPSIRKKKIVKSIPLDTCGKPIFPIVLGDFTVHSLGEVCEKPDYHTEDLIYPVGYCSTRIYGSLKDPEKQCVYTCKVMDGGQAPRFEIVADTDLDVPLVSTSIDQCHSMLLSLINRCLSTEVVNTKGRGADFFGLSHPTIHHLIQASPGVRKCKGYIWTKFEVNPNYEYVADDTEASLSYNALLRSISFSKSHLESMMKHEQNVEYGEDNVTALNILLS